ncbi:MAG: alpha/beta hydrolase [Proteobacteria bacterium]|nr:alpha/beta hydrolase [Pseudomonadota bacterium]
MSKQDQSGKPGMPPKHPLLLIPAFGCDERLYRPLLPNLGAFLPVQTSVFAAPRYAQMADMALATMPGPFIVLGTSMGGRVALEVTLAAPDRVKGLVIIGAGAGATADPVAGMRRATRIAGGEQDQVIREMSEIVAHLPGPRGQATRDAFYDMGSKMDRQALAMQAEALAHRIDLWPRLKEITCPVLCLWGVHDQFVPAEDGRRIAETVNNGRYVELQQCGHFPSLEYPAETAAAISGWLRDNELS